MKLDVKLNKQTDDNAAALKSAAKRVKDATETIDEAWSRIFAMKNSDNDMRKLREVKRAMDEGVIGRELESASKRFSKAEALRLHKVLAEQQREQKLADLVANTPDNYVLVNEISQVDGVIGDIKASKYVGYDCETYGKDNGALDPWSGGIAGICISANGRHYYVPLAHTTGDNLPIDGVMRIFKALENVRLIMHNAPFDCKWAAVKYNVDLTQALYADTRIMAMTLDENRSHRLKDLITDWLKQPSDNFDELFGKTPFNEIDIDVALVYGAGDTEKTLDLYHWMMKHLNTERLAPLKRLIFEIEMPVARRFIYADLRGLKFDVERAKELDAKLAEEEQELKRQIFELAGVEINLNSPAQVADLFYKRLMLTDYGKGSTNSRFVKKIAKEHPIEIGRA